LFNDLRGKIERDGSFIFGEDFIEKELSADYWKNERERTSLILMKLLDQFISWLKIVAGPV
jgi:hypothetical protein